MLNSNIRINKYTKFNSEIKIISHVMFSDCFWTMLNALGSCFPSALYNTSSVPAPFGMPLFCFWSSFPFVLHRTISMLRPSRFQRYFLRLRHRGRPTRSQQFICYSALVRSRLPSFDGVARTRSLRPYLILFTLPISNLWKVKTLDPYKKIHSFSK